MGVDEHRAELAELTRQALAGRVAADLAHEINGLLVGVISVAQDAEQAQSLAELRRALETTAESGRRIAALVGAFQASFPRTPDEPGACGDLTAALDRTIALCRKRMRLRQVHFLSNHGTLPGVRMQTGVLEQVLLQLIQTALDAMSAGGLLELRTDVLPDAVALSFRFGGTDAPDASDVSDRSDTPDALVRTASAAPACDPTDSLAWAVVTDIVRDHGGELTAEHAPGTGSRFTLILRRADSEKPRQPHN